MVLFADHLKNDSVAANTSTTSDTSQVQPVTPASAPTTTPQTTPTTATSSSSTSPYKDGTYSASSSYFVPAGNESIKVSLTISGGTVTGASIQNSEGDPTSAQFQQNFAAQYKNYVVGQKIANLQIGIIAGASDTSQGFNNAVSQIASQAQA